MKLKIFSFLAFLSLFSITFNPLYSYPKFAAYTGSKCQNCHVNPTGGGIRHFGGVKYSRENLFIKPFEKANKETEFDPWITKAIQIGADMRMIFIDDQVGEGQPNFNTFFQMQGDLYVKANINKYLTLMIAPGLYIPNTFGPNPLATKYEIYGMIWNLPAGAYLKAGRFIPNFGIKIPEHRAFSRQFNDFYTPYASDAGFEVGISPGPFFLTAGFSNGSSLNKAGMRNNSFDFDAQKQFVATGDFRWADKKERYTFGLGGSFLTNPFKYDQQNNINALRQIGAGFLSIGLFNRVAILAEYDYNRLDLRDSAKTRTIFQTIFAEMDIKLAKGLEIKLQFENYDPQLGIKNGQLERRRYSFGISFFPLTGLEIETMYRYVQEPNKALNVKNNEFQDQIKFYF